jgi:hypothetical protein
MSVLAKLIVGLGLDASEYDKGLDGAEKKADGFGSKLGGFLGSAMKVGLAATAGGVIGVIGAIVSGVASNAEFERYETQFGVLLGSTEAAKSRLEDLARFGAQTPFELPEVVRADKILQGFGLHSLEAAEKFKFSGEQIRTIAGDVASGTGASFEEMSLLIGKMSAGATGEAISRMAELGIASRSELAELGLEFDKSGALLSPLPQAMETVLKLMEEKYGGMMVAQSGTFEGMMSNMQDWVSGTLRTMSAPIFEVAKEKLQGLLTFLNDPATQASLNSIAVAIAEGVGKAIDWISNVGIPALTKAWAEVNIAFNTATTFINTNLMPAFNMFVGFVRDHTGPVLAGLAAMLLVVVVPAFVSWAIAAGSAALATVVALAPVILIVTAVGVAVGLLYAAWESNFLGIRDIVTEIWNTYLSPIFNTVVAWLQENIPIALQRLSDFWQNTLLPAIVVVRDYLADVVIPMFVNFVTTTIASVNRGLQVLANFWTLTLKPAVMGVYNFFKTYVIPLFDAFAAVKMAAQNLAMRTLAAIWTGTVLPAIDKVAKFVETYVIPIYEKFTTWIENVKKQALRMAFFFLGNVQPILQALNGIIEQKVIPAWELFDTIMGGVADAAGHIGDAISGVIDWLNDLASAIDSISIPDWLQGHSPPPLANWFSHIAGAAKSVNAEFDQFNQKLADGKLIMPQVPFGINGSAIQTIQSGPQLNITANYKHQEERTIRDEIKMQAMLLNIKPMG